MFGYEYPLLLNVNDNDLLRFANHMVHFAQLFLQNNKDTIFN